jgi:long-chain acyl-CoA synthetase
VYPADDLFKRLEVGRGTPESVDVIKESIDDIVDRVNKVLQPYQRVSRVTILSEPLEMTTTRKVKRIYTK